jgi:hypothetical protein
MNVEFFGSGMKYFRAMRTIFVMFKFQSAKRSHKKAKTTHEHFNLFMLLVKTLQPEEAEKREREKFNSEKSL